VRGYNVAVVGATGAVGMEMLSILEERKFPIKKLKLLASARSAGKGIEFRGETIIVQEVKPSSFDGVEMAFFGAGGSVSKAFVHEAVHRGCIVIDNSSAFRMDMDVPLVVPEVNGEDVRNHKGIIANPNCTTTIMVVPLKPLHELAGIKRLVISTYQAVSGAGAKGMDELEDQVLAYAENREIHPRVLPVASLEKHYQIAFNVIPQVDVFDDAGYTKEEWKMVNETRKILHDDSLQISCTTVRVPVLRSHAESVNIEFKRKVSRNEAIEVLSNAPGVVECDDAENMEYPMPLTTSGKDAVYVGRIREDISLETGLNLWIVGDQIRKGAALNAVQIAEYLAANELV
jgi:aspartate-semialdehyde dehydrogenase